MTTDDADDNFDMSDSDIPEDVSSVEDLEGIDGVEVEREYWADYTHQHHGILFCWRNNLKQVLLAVEESIAGETHSDDYDIVLLTASGDFITCLDTVETEEEALKQALLYQQKYPQGNFPELEDRDTDKSDEFVPLTKTGAEQTKSESEEVEGTTKRGLIEKLRSILE